MTRKIERLVTLILDITKFKKLAELNNAYVVLEVKQEKDVISSVETFRKL